MPVTLTLDEKWNNVVFGLLAAFVGNAVECVLYGIHLVLVVAVAYNIGPQFARRWLSLVASFVLFAICSVIWAMGLYIAANQLKMLKDPSTMVPGMAQLEWFRCGLFIVAMFLGDIILGWRVSIIYHRQSILWVVVVQAIPLLVAAVLGTATFACMTRISLAAPNTPVCDTIIRTGQQVLFSISAAENVFAAVMLGRIALKHQRTMRGSGLRKKNSVIRVLYILAISTIVYCCLWVPLVLILFASTTSKTYSWYGSAQFALGTLEYTFQQLVGIFPTLVTFLNDLAVFGERRSRSRSRSVSVSMSRSRTAVAGGGGSKGGRGTSDYHAEKYAYPMSPTRKLDRDLTITEQETSVMEIAPTASGFGVATTASGFGVAH